MTSVAEGPAKVASLDNALRHLVRIAGAIAGANEPQLRSVMSGALRDVDPSAVEEIILQSYLFAGFPRALNAARTWRAVSGRRAPEGDVEASPAEIRAWRERGEETCEIVYGDSYRRLRANIRALHPTLDEWMIVDGYGKVLSRSRVDLRTRELCVVAACAVAGQQRQLHSHLRGALNTGSSAEEIAAVLEVLSDLVPPEDLTRYRQLLQKVQNQ